MNRSCPKKSAKQICFVKNNTNVLPPGNYFVGDPCYFMNDLIYDSVWVDGFHKAPGHYSLPDGRGFIITNISENGLSSSDLKTYSIDSGNFGIFSVDLGDYSKYTGNGTFYSFSLPVSFNYKNGTLTMKQGNSVVTFESYEHFSDDGGYDSVG